MKDDTVQLLKKCGLRLTQNRMAILRILLESEPALSAAEIRQRLNGHCDRVTLYRNLKLLMQKGLIHQIVVDNQVSKFVMPQAVQDPEHRHTEHVHFRCIRCQKVQCLPEQQIGEIDLPEGFSRIECSFVVQGICGECNEKVRLNEN